MKDYYRILGVINTAEDIVIRAAYRALAQRYHPDKFDGSPELAKSKMQEINEAYAVLSDFEKRAEYDKKFDYQSEEDTDIEDSINSELDQIWNEVTEYYPDLIDLANRLEKISIQLVQTFKVQVLEKKCFDQRKFVADQVEKSFLNNYFGPNEKIVEFGKNLILCKFKSAAKKLNRAAEILGSSIEPDVVISKIKKSEFNPTEKVIFDLLERHRNERFNFYISKAEIELALQMKMHELDARKFISGNFQGELNWSKSLHPNESAEENIYFIKSRNFLSDAINFDTVLHECKRLAWAVM